MRRDEFPIIDSYVKKEINAVLDKIRAEIEESITDYILYEEDTNTAKRMGDVMTKVFEIIDKYMAESEEQTE